MNVFANVSFHWYGFIVGLAVVCAFLVAEKYVLAWKVPKQIFSKYAFMTMCAGFVGARAWHVVTDFQYYVGQDWRAVFFIWNGGMSVIGALLGGGMVLAIYGLLVAQERKYICTYLDALAIALPVGQIIGRIANFVNGELMGLPTQLPWGIFVPEQNRPSQYVEFNTFHPLFAYEMIGLSIFLWLLLRIVRHYKKNGKMQGHLFGLYVGWYSVLRFFLDFLRIERDPVIAGLGINQFVILCIGLATGLWWQKKCTIKHTR